MFKMPKPVPLLFCHTAQEECHYSEAQLKQAVRDALEDVKTALLKEPTQLIARWKIAEIIESLKEGL